MAVDFQQFKNLTPETRIKELQELIEELKKEIAEKEEEIKTAEHLLSTANEESKMLERMEIPAPAKSKQKSKASAIEEKITEELPEEKRLTREEQVELEKLLATAPPRSPEIIHKIAHRPVEELYNEVRRIYDRQKETGVETREEREMLYAIRKGFEIKREEGYQPAGKQKHLMTAAEQMAENMYQSGAGAYKRTPG